MTPFEKLTCWISVGNGFEKLFALHVIFICAFVAKRYLKHQDVPKTRQFTVGDNPLIKFLSMARRENESVSTSKL